MKFHENKTLAKITEFTVVIGQSSLMLYKEFDSMQILVAIMATERNLF